MIDFILIRRRPEREKYFQHLLKVTDEHRARMSADDLSEQTLRDRLIRLPETELSEVLTSRELEDLYMGSRERVTDIELAHIRGLPTSLPSIYSDAARRAEIAGFDGVELHYAHA